jgi:hypothetical protein
MLEAVRERMRHQRASDAAEPEDPPPAPAPAPAAPTARLPVEDLEQLTAEARYHRDRYELYHARVISGSQRATSPVRLRELEHAATAAEERLANARRR